MKTKLIIVIPAYNCAKTIENVFKRISKETFKTINKFIIVNDGSKDSTQDVALKLKKKYKKIKIIRFEKNKGYGAVQKAGFSKALELDADAAVLLHSDGQYPPEYLGKILEPLLTDKADVVLGSRILGKGALKGGMPVHKYLGNRFLTFIENICYGMNISEYHTGYTAYSKKALLTIPFTKLSDTFHFDGEMIMMSGKKKLRIKEIGIPTTYAEEKSYLNVITYGLDVLKIMLKYKIGRYNF